MNLYSNVVRNKKVGRDIAIGFVLYVRKPAMNKMFSDMHLCVVHSAGHWVLTLIVRYAKVAGGLLLAEKPEGARL